MAAHTSTACEILRKWHKLYLLICCDIFPLLIHVSTVHRAHCIADVFTVSSASSISSHKLQICLAVLLSFAQFVFIITRNIRRRRGCQSNWIRFGVVFVTLFSFAVISTFQQIVAGVRNLFGTVCSVLLPCRVSFVAVYDCISVCLCD